MGCEKRPPHEQMQVTEIRIPARNQPISSLRCNYITQATKQVRNADRENNRYCNGNVVEQLHDQLASSIGKGTALSSNEWELSRCRPITGEGNQALAVCFSDWLDLLAASSI